MKNTLLVVAAVATLMASSPSWSQTQLAPDNVSGTHLVSAEQIIELAATTPNLVIIDARTATDHSEGYIEGSINLTDTDTTPETLAQHVPGKDTPVLFYCNGERCLRSSNSARRAVNWGYTKVYWFRGGWEEWISKELPAAH